MFPRVQLTLFHHLFRKWPGTGQATSHYLNQWWLNLMMHICVTRPQWVKHLSITHPWYVQGNVFENVVQKWRYFCLGLAVLNFLLWLHQGGCLYVDRFVITVSPGDCHCDSLRLGQMWPPCRRTDASVWELLTATNAQIVFYRHALVYMYCCHYFMLLIVMTCDSVYIMNEIFVWTQVVNKLLLLLHHYR